MRFRLFISPKNHINRKQNIYLWQRIGYLQNSHTQNLRISVRSNIYPQIKKFRNFVKRKHHHHHHHHQAAINNSWTLPECWAKNNKAEQWKLLRPEYGATCLPSAHPNTTVKIYWVKVPVSYSVTSFPNNWVKLEALTYQTCNGFT